MTGSHRKRLPLARVPWTTFPSNTIHDSILQYQQDTSFTTTSTQRPFTPLLLGRKAPSDATLLISWDPYTPTLQPIPTRLVFLQATSSAGHSLTYRVLPNRRTHRSSETIALPNFSNSTETFSSPLRPAVQIVPLFRVHRLTLTRRTPHTDDVTTLTLPATTEPRLSSSGQGTLHFLFFPPFFYFFRINPSSHFPAYLLSARVTPWFILTHFSVFMFLR